VRNSTSMTPAERLQALRQGRPSDRVPLLYFILGFCAKNVGYPISSVYSEPEKSLEAQLRTQEQYGYDSEPFFGYASYGGYEFGGEISLPDGQYEQAPSHTRFAVQDEKDAENLTLPDVATAGMLPLAMRFARLQVERQITPSVVVGGPFTVAGNICSVDRLCRWVIKKPELVDHVLRLVTDHLVDVARHWIDTFGTERVYMQIWEPLTSNQIISPRHFEKVVLPYQIELHQKVLEMGIGRILCHICGEQNQNLPAWAQVPMGDQGIVSVGREVDISTAIEYFGDNCIIAGNIDPAILQTGTPGEIYELCRQAIEKGRHAPRGYALMQGCEVPINTPPRNLQAMKGAADDFGWY
jgi:uroporphyrinogen decarboxylase